MMANFHIWKYEAQEMEDTKVLSVRRASWLLQWQENNLGEMCLWDLNKTKQFHRKALDGSSVVHGINIGNQFGIFPIPWQLPKP